jgi:hypothetical protein
MVSDERKGLRQRFRAKPSHTVIGPIQGIILKNYTPDVQNKRWSELWIILSNLQQDQTRLSDRWADCVSQKMLVQNP